MAVFPLTPGALHAGLTRTIGVPYGWRPSAATVVRILTVSGAVVGAAVLALVATVDLFREGISFVGLASYPIVWLTTFALFVAVNGLAFSALAHVLARLGGGGGQYGALVVAMCFVGVRYVVAVALLALLQVLVVEVFALPAFEDSWPAALFGLVYIVLLVWAWVMQLAAVAHVHGFDSPWAVVGTGTAILVLVSVAVVFAYIVLL